MIGLLGCAPLAILIGLKLWASWWLYQFVAAWIATGMLPSFWSFVWALFLVAFVLDGSLSVKTND